MSQISLNRGEPGVALKSPSNCDRMRVILNGEPLKEVDCFKYLGSQVAADGVCERDVVYTGLMRDIELGER